MPELCSCHWTTAGGRGALRLHLEAADRATHRDIEPSGGTLVAFFSGDLHHEVLPAARERSSAVGWFTTRP